MVAATNAVGSKEPRAAWYEAKPILGVDGAAAVEPPRERPANQNALTGGGPRPEEIERLRELARRPQPQVKGEGLDTPQIAARIREDIKAAAQAGVPPASQRSCVRLATA